jgi:SAM-dependent methyltransferase
MPPKVTPVSLGNQHLSSISRLLLSINSSISKSKDYFLKTDYPSFWAKRIRAEKYEEHYRKRFLGLLGVKAGECILEVGAGEGRFVNDVLNQRACYVGIDISAAMLLTARERFLSPRESEANFVVADAEKLPFRPNAFDAVFSFATFFFLEDHRKVLEEMARVTRDLILLELRNSLSWAVLQSIPLRVVLGRQSLLRLVLRVEALRPLLIKTIGQRKVTRLQDLVIVYRLRQPFFGVSPFTIGGLFRRAGVSINHVEGHSMPKNRHKESQTPPVTQGIRSWKKWVMPVLLVVAHKTNIEQRQEEHR